MVRFLMGLLVLALFGCPAAGRNAADGSDGAQDLDGAEESPPPCTSNADCNDGIACTDDACLVGGVCGHMPINALCPTMGERCLPATGCSAVECVTDADCNDFAFCTGPEYCVLNTCRPGVPPDCDDGNTCTTDGCNIATDQCVHNPAPGCTPDGGTEGGAMPFDPARDYSGDFRIAPTQSSSCGAATYSVSMLHFAIAAGALTVQAGPFTLSQTPAPTGADFAVTFTQTDCGTYTLMGTFLDSNSFSGHWTATFSGGCSFCGGQSADVFGVRI